MEVILLVKSRHFSLGVGFLSVVILVTLVGKQPISTLNFSQSLARFSMVALAEVLAFLIFLVPVRVGSGRRSPWSQDCFRYGICTALTVGMILVTYFALASALIPEKAVPRWTEIVIGAVYLVNTIGLFRAIVRTGGPSRSLYANLVPVQLAGFLLLEQQKESLMSTTNTGNHPQHLVFLFAVVAIAAWIGSALASDYKPGNTPNTDELPDFSFWITVECIAGMVLTLVGYFLPRQPWFTAILIGAFRRQ
jgi:hypothetical protein